MAQQQEFHPGLSLAGAVDLESLKHQVKAEPGQAGGAPAAGGYVIDTTENTFQAMVQTSATFPILLLLWIPTDDRLFPMARTLGDAVNKLKGQIQLSRIDIVSYPSIAQAFQVQGAPALFALIGGRPMPILQGLPGDDELKQIVDQVIPKLISVAAQSGVNGTAPYSGDPDSADGDGAVPVTAQVRRLVPTWCRPSIRKRTSLRRRAITPVPPRPTSRCCRRTPMTRSPRGSARRRCCWRVRRPLTCARYARPPQIVPMTSKRSWPWRMWT